MKEAHRANTRSLLLSALVLSSAAFQARAYYHPDEGRWISRDPINDVGFRKLLPRSLGISPLDGPSFRMPVFQGEQAHILLSDLLKKLPEPKRIYIDEERQLYGFVFNDPVNATDLLGLQLCVCCFKFSVGKLYIDASCKGVLSIWVIDEGSAPAAGGTAGSWVSADGYVLGGTTYKIDGSTCVKMTCTASSVSVETCVNLAAGIGGKKPPYAVPGGTFAGPPKEPAAGSTPPVVK